MVIKEHPEWSDKYPAVDGFSFNSIEEVNAMRKDYPNNPSHYYLVPKNALRSDIEKIIGLNDQDFLKWFSERKIAAQTMLKNYELIGEIPHLSYAYEGHGLETLSSNIHINDMIQVLKKGIEYLDVIKQVRDESKKTE